MKCIISTKYRYKYFNEITEYMDKYLKGFTDIYKTYVYDKFDNKWTIRIPGRTVGHIEVDNNNHIINIKIYEDCIKYYEKEMLNNIHKFYNIKLIMES